MVIMPDADPDQVVSSLDGRGLWLRWRALYGYFSCGLCGRGGGRQALSDLVAEINTMKVGAGMSADEPNMGPLVTREHADKVLGYIHQGISEGASLVVDGRDFVVAGNENGYFVGPTLFDNVKPGCGSRAKRSSVRFYPLFALIATKRLLDLSMPMVW